MKVLIIIIYNCYNYSQRQFSHSGHSQVAPEGFRAAQSAWQPQWFACSQGFCLATHKWGEALCSLALQHHPCPQALGCTSTRAAAVFSQVACASQCQAHVFTLSWESSDLDKTKPKKTPSPFFLTVDKRKLCLEQMEEDVPFTGAPNSVLDLFFLGCGRHSVWDPSNSICF